MSRYDHLCALILSIVEHPGITSKKRKGQDDVNKPAKPHAALANPKGAEGKTNKSTQKVAVSLPRNYVASENSTESESSGNESPIHHAMFARAQMDPMPKLSVQSIFGPKSRPAHTRQGGTRIALATTNRAPASSVRQLCTGSTKAR